jgi:NADP-dependent 3-hydroxy acid dehydrogenase YdfG
MSSNIEGRVIVIRGSSGGLGEAAARLLSAQGARVVLGAHRPDRVESFSADLSGWMP